MAKATKKRRHPGVTLVRPDEERRIGWRVRFRDPDSGKYVKRALDANLTTATARRNHAVRLSEKLTRRRAALETGATRKTGAAIKKAIEVYFDANPGLRPRTLKEYRRATRKLIDFCEQHSIRSADDLDRRRLMQFRESLIKEPKQGTRKRRADRTINKELTSVGTALRYLVKREEFSQLNLESVLVATEHFGNEPSKAAQPMVVGEIRHTLEACIEHDEATFEMTREERNSEERNTLRHDPIGAFVAFVLLTGLRVDSEALRIEWSHVDFESEVINIKGWSKTRRERRVSLSESPALLKLLDAQHELTGGKGRVWRMSYNQLLNARRRLIEVYDAPKAFGWQVCRATCQSFLASSPSIYGAASIYLTAARGGHNVQTCERHYARAVKVADPKATTIEGAMGIEEHVDQIIEDLEAACEASRAVA